METAVFAETLVIFDIRLDSSPKAEVILSYVIRGWKDSNGLRRVEEEQDVDMLLKISSCHFLLMVFSLFGKQSYLVSRIVIILVQI
jgi:hypothetical protein